MFILQYCRRLAQSYYTKISNKSTTRADISNSSQNNKTAFANMYLKMFTGKQRTKFANTV